mmetsp:Transcript_104921/g.277224  ORF Transcript_104921/g.277224 Transcript_104921/m.277224 type:complete len:256 (+) Transcript_104921:1687-2454(+)
MLHYDFHAKFRPVNVLLQEENLVPSVALGALFQKCLHGLLCGKDFDDTNRGRTFRWLQDRRERNLTHSLLNVLRRGTWERFPRLQPIGNEALAGFVFEHASPYCLVAVRHHTEPLCDQSGQEQVLVVRVVGTSNVANRRGPQGVHDCIGELRFLRKLSEAWNDHHLVHHTRDLHLMSPRTLAINDDSAHAQLVHPLEHAKAASSGPAANYQRHHARSVGIHEHHVAKTECRQASGKNRPQTQDNVASTRAWAKMA